MGDLGTGNVGIKDLKDLFDCFVFGGSEMGRNRREKIALVLGGGGSRGAYEIGAWQALRELDVSIDIVTGTSVGAINGAMIVQDDFELAVQLWKEIETNMIFEGDLKEIFIKRGMGCMGLEILLREYIDEEKIRRSPLDYGIVTAQFPLFSPQYLFKEDIPHGKIHDYILASASFFPAIRSHIIGNSQFVDGGYIDNLPVGMALEKKAKLVIAVDLACIGIINKKHLRQAEHLKILSCPWDLGNFLVFDTNNAKRLLRLGYLDTMKAFHIFDGTYFTFAKGVFDNRMLRRAEAVARIFELDPLIIYKEFSLNKRLMQALQQNKIKDTGEKSRGFLTSISPENFSELPKKINRKRLVAFLANSFKEGRTETSLLLSKPARRLLREEILAASYLYQKNLI